MSKPWDDELDAPSPEELAESDALVRWLAGGDRSEGLSSEVEGMSFLLRTQDDFSLSPGADARIAAEIAERARHFDAGRTTRARWRAWMWLLPLPLAAGLGVWLLLPATFLGKGTATEPPVGVLPEPTVELLTAQLTLLEGPGADRTEFTRQMRAYREQVFAVMEDR